MKTGGSLLLHQIIYKGGPLLWPCITILSCSSFRPPMLTPMHEAVCPYHILLQLHQLLQKSYSYLNRCLRVLWRLHKIALGPEGIPSFLKLFILFCQDGQERLRKMTRLWDQSSIGNGSYQPKTFIPPPGRDYILEEKHASHPGISHMKTLSHSFVWWPGLDENIESFVKNCSKCQVHCPSPPAAPSLPWRWPACPWFRLHLDFAGPFMDNMFLIVIDAYSKWLEVKVMKSTTSTAII